MLHFYVVHKTNFLLGNSLGKQQSLLVQSLPQKGRYSLYCNDQIYRYISFDGMDFNASKYRAY